MGGMHYIKSWAGLLKIGEFLALLVAFSCLADFTNKSETNGAFKFFLFVTITAWLITIALFVLFLTDYHERITINWTLAMIIYSAITTFMLLISSSLVADKARKFRRSEVLVQVQRHKEYRNKCDNFGDHHVPCSNVEAAVVFGFMALALFFADTVFYFFQYHSFDENNDQSGFVQQDHIGPPPDYKPDTEEIP